MVDQYIEQSVCHREPRGRRHKRRRRVENGQHDNSSANTGAVPADSPSVADAEVPGEGNAQGIEAEIPETSRREVEELERIARSPHSGDAPGTKTKFSLNDALVYGFCVLGIVLSLNVFRIDLFRTLTRQAEEPIGTITFKYKAAQRRFVDRVLWDRLQKDSPVYDGDFIRTAELSEATVTFEGGGAVINLPENSLIQLHHAQGGIRVDVNEGEVGASAEDSSVVLAAGDSLVTVETGAVVTAGLAGGDFTLRVMEGAASFAGPGGTGNISAGETVALNEAGLRPVREATALLPRPQARFLSPRPGKFPVLFRWNRVDLAPEELTRLEVAEDRGFSRIVLIEDSLYDAVAVELEPGLYYWRVSLVNDQGDGSSPNILSFRILAAPAPALITPVEGYSYQFRVKKPFVRFQWTETGEADSYVLQVADNPDMKDPVLSEEVRGTSFYFSGLGPGTWHWRALPVFPAFYEGAAGAGAPASFSIVQSGALGSPELRSPRDRGMVNVAAGQEDVYFSWRPEAEASSYRILVSANPGLEDPVIDETVRDNFYTRRAGRDALGPGQYYWSVLQTDIEGNDSEPAPTRSFVALEGEPIQRLVFPPDGYVAEASLLPDLRFTWRSNLPFQTRFQIAGDRGFASPFIDEAAGGEAFQGRMLPEGTWYWRILARGSGDAFFQTPPRSFVAAASISAPLLLEPVPDREVFIQEEKPLIFSWAAPAGAEYYQFRLYHGGNRNSPVYENSLVEGTGEDLSLSGYPEGEYHWTVRGLAAESARSTRRTGLLAEGVFTARRLRPVTLDYPGNNAELDGLRAYYEPETLRWSSGDAVGTSRFILSSRSDFAGTPLRRIDNPPRHIVLPRLGAGNYYWTIQAETPDGYDISARTPGRFRVRPMPLLPRAANRLPEDGKRIGGAELRENRRILFSWDAVRGATGYLFVLTNAGTGRTILRRGPTAATTFALEDLTALDVGTFVWQVEAVMAEQARGGAAGAIIRRGELGESRFTIDFDLPDTPAPGEPGILYGNE
jgi:hypothetical protein